MWRTIEGPVTRRIYCRHDDCDHSDLEETGKRPAICPGCQRVAAWTLEKTAASIIRASPADSEPAATHPYRLNFNDRWFLRKLRIAQDPPEDGA